jgi:hypothetical protein
VFPKSDAQQQFPIAELCGRADTEDIRRDNHDRRWVGTDGWARYRLRRETMSTNNTPIGVRVRMTALSLLTLIGLAVLCIVALVNLKGNLLEDRKLKTRNLVEVALGIVSHFHQLSTRGVLPEADARLAAIATLRDLRYAGTDYFFGFDTNHVYFLLPTKPEFEGQNKKEMKDAKGTFLIQELVAAAQAGGGYVNYWFPRSGSDIPEPKLSYAALFAPWNWVVGTGIYIDDVDATFRRETLILGGIAMALLALIAVISWRLARGVLRQLGGEPAYAAAATARIAAGDLATPVIADTRFSDSLLMAMQRMQGRLSEVFRSIDAAAQLLSNNAEALSTTAAEVSRAAGAQAEATAATAASIEEMTVSINEVSAQAQQTEVNSKRTAGLADESVTVIQRAAGEIESMVTTVGGSATQVQGAAAALAGDRRHRAGDQGDRRPDQPVGAQRGDRSGTCRRTGAWFLPSLPTRCGNSPNGRRRRRSRSRTRSSRFRRRPASPSPASRPPCRRPAAASNWSARRPRCSI